MDDFWYVEEYGENEPLHVFKTEEEAKFWVNAMNLCHPTKSYARYRWSENG